VRLLVLLFGYLRDVPFAEPDAPWRMLSSGMLRRVALVGPDVSEERRAYIIRVKRFGYR
jgi:hypothetical protein